MSTETYVGQSTFHYGEVPEEITDREIHEKPSPRVQKLLDEYYNATLMLDPDYTIAYTNAWKANVGEHPIYRRGLATKAGLEALEPLIRPGEKLVMSHTKYVRGAALIPWTANEAILNEAERKAKDQAEGRASNAALDEVTILASGGGLVTEDTDELISISRRLGLKREDYADLLEACQYWDGTSVETSSWKWGRLHPEYDALVKYKDAVLMSSDMEYGNRHGRSVNSFAIVFAIGLEGMKDECRRLIKEHASDGQNVDRVAFWHAIIATIEGTQQWMLNYADEALRLAAEETDAKQKKEYEEIAECLQYISKNPPRNFKDALQLHWSCQLEVYVEMQGSGFSPGRLGAVLYPYWKKDMDEGAITEEETLELLELMRVKYNEIEIATSSATSGILGGNTFNNVCLGGQMPDGTPGGNDLERLFIKAASRCQTVSPTLTVLYDPALPKNFLMEAIECNKTGSGMPAWVSNRVGIEYCMNTHGEEGITLPDARAWSVGGCLEIQPGAVVDGVIGAGSYSSSGINFINVPKVLELTLFDGKDPRTGTQVFEPTGKTFNSYEELYEDFTYKFTEVIRVFEELYNFKTSSAFELDEPMLFSALTSDCLEKGAGIDHQGSRYNRDFTCWITGQVNAVNSLASIKKNVFDDKKFSIDELKDALINNFGFENALQTGKFSMLDQSKNTSDSHWDRIHSLCLKAPKYGNDDKYADDIYVEVANTFRDAAESVTDVWGRKWVGSMLSVSTQGTLGQADIASADGRLAGVSLADGGQSPFPGTDTNGPYAVLNSASIFDHSDYKNTQLNMKVHPASIKGQQGSEKLLELVQGFLNQGGYHIQFNVVDSRMLKKAQENPNEYRDLLVRVAGFTQYWVEVSKPVQDEIIARTEYETI